MDSVRSATSDMKDALSSQSSEGAYNPAPSPSFPQFSRLPQELRLKIWDFALEPRVHRLHLHVERSSPWDDIPEQEEDDSEPLDLRWHPQYMTITSCNGTLNCECKTLPVSSQSIMPRPTVLLACREIRDFAIGRYLRCLENEYDSRGRRVKVPVPRPLEGSIDSFPRRGLIFNPEKDAIMLSANIASSEDVATLHQFTAIAAREIPQIRKVVINVRIGMPPYKWYERNRNEYWKKWVQNGWWVPGKSLVKIKGLRKVIILRPVGCESMLPVEWEERCKGQWKEELGNLTDIWPAEWKGRMPLLRFVQSVEERGSGAGIPGVGTAY